MKKNPQLLTFGVVLLVGLLGVGLIQVIAGMGTNFSQRWFTLVGAATVCATLVGYHFFDGTRPVPSRVRLQYSLMCAGVNGAVSLLCFVVTSRAWGPGDLPPDKSGFFYQLTHPWIFGELGQTIGGYSTQSSASWQGMTVMGVVLGFAVCYYGFRHINET